jgi:hypothetical protein
MQSCKSLTECESHVHHTVFVFEQGYERPAHWFTLEPCSRLGKGFLKKIKGGKRCSQVLWDFPL